ncbi:MAG: rod shape-determining protein MreC [Actinomycetota bacterium]|nr:rod shape-determining protein MreC [Actinomycetota bacterium]MDQ3679823.1 rod shape-determining protein MreC [Actinomycetota bacterium]
MAVYRRTARPRFILLLLVLTAVTLLTLDERAGGLAVVDTVRDGARDALAPVRDATDSAVRPVANFFQGIIHYGRLEETNNRLREQLAERDAELARTADAQRERQDLLDQQSLEFAGDIPAVSARVVLASPSNLDLTVEINRGRDAGVSPGMPVVTGAGLVGRVVDVSRTRATIMLITSPTSNVGVRLATSGEVGVAVGRGARSPLNVDNVDPAVKVSQGEAVVTSGLQQSVFPPGIPVGRVKTARATPEALQQDVTIEPMVELRRLSFVKVLQWGSR